MHTHTVNVGEHSLLRNSASLYAILATDLGYWLENQQEMDAVCRCKYKPRL